MYNKMKTPNVLIVSFFVMTFAIGTEYFSRFFFLLLIGALIGLFYFFEAGIIPKSTLKIFMWFVIVNFGVIVSKMFYTPETSMVVNVMFIIQLILFSFVFLHVFQHCSLPKSFLLLTSYFYLPHLLGLILGVVTTKPGEFGELTFGGFHRDPNYLSPDLLFSVLSQLFVYKIYSNRLLLFSNTLNFIFTIYLLLFTGSRTASISLIIILLLVFIYYLSISKSKIKKIILPIVVVFAIIGFGDYLIQSDNNRISYIYKRFTMSNKGGDLIENERYFVWGISYDLISSGRLFKGYGNEMFLKMQYHFVSHNVFLDAGIRYGKYTFYSHVLLTLFSMILFIRKFIKKKYVLGFNSHSYMFAFVTSQLIMMNSISVSNKHMYWYVLLILISYGLFSPNGQTTSMIK